MRYLLDTCVLSELVKNAPNPRVLRWLENQKEQSLCTSAMTCAELHRGVGRLPASKRKSELSLWLQNLEAGFEGRILAFDQSVAQVWSQMTVEAQARGKSMAAFDSIIAATARKHGCHLVTRNIRDFAHAGLDLLNPWESA